MVNSRVTNVNLATALNSVPVDGRGDEDERDEKVAHGEEEEGPVGLLSDAAAADEGEEEAQVEDEAGHDSEAQEAGVAPTVKPANMNQVKFKVNITSL